MCNAFAKIWFSYSTLGEFSNGNAKEHTASSLMKLDCELMKNRTYTAGRHMIIFRRKQNAFEWSSDNPDDWRLSTYEAGNLWKNTFFLKLITWAICSCVLIVEKLIPYKRPPYDHHGVNFQHSPQCISQELWCGCNASDIVSARALHICQCGCRLFHATAIRHHPFLWVYVQCIC